MHSWHFILLSSLPSVVEGMGQPRFSTNYKIALPICGVSVLCGSALHACTQSGRFKILGDCLGSFPFQDKENLQKEVQEVKRRALRMVKDSPEFYHKMELVLNASSPSPAMAAAAVPHIPKDSNAGDTDEDESLLSDEVMDTLAKDLSECYM